jgi:hypothetical protein
VGQNKILYVCFWKMRLICDKNVYNLKNANFTNKSEKCLQDRAGFFALHDSKVITYSIWKDFNIADRCSLLHRN